MDPFVGEIILGPYGFTPKGFAECNGQLLPIAQNTALFSLLGTYYGGDGKSTFALPDLRDRVAIQVGQGPGLSNREQGEMGGVASVVLTEAQTPAHTHTLQASNGGTALSKAPGGKLYAATTQGPPTRPALRWQSPMRCPLHRRMKTAIHSLH
jgi:microcystin-dependent protein